MSAAVAILCGVSFIAGVREGDWRPKHVAQRVQRAPCVRFRAKHVHLWAASACATGCDATKWVLLAQRTPRV
jgi:hypothetical protein